MKINRKDPFKNRAMTLFIYNLGELEAPLDCNTREEKLRHFGLHPYNGEILNGLPKIDFLKILKSHFVEMKIEGNHGTLISDRYKIYCYPTKEVEANFKELMIVGKQAITEVLELGKIHNWAVMSPGRGELIDLSSLPSYGYLSLEEYYGDE